MNYSDSAAMVRVDFFKPTGKHYTTEAVDMSGLYDEPSGPTVALATALMRQAGDRLLGLTAVCLRPFHRFPHPVMVLHNHKIGDWAMLTNPSAAVGIYDNKTVEGALNS